MARRPLLVASCVAGSVALVAAGLVASGETAPSRLRASSTAVTLSQGQVRGQVIVDNTGDAEVNGFRAQVKVGGIGAGSVEVRPVRSHGRRTVTFTVPVPAAVRAGRRTVQVCLGGRTCTRVGAVAVGAVTGSVATIPTDPIDHPVDRTFTVGDDDDPDYWITVPRSYDASNRTPITLFVWLHGCGGYGYQDINTISPHGSAQHWIAVAVGGNEGECWDVDADPDRVMRTISDVETHFDIDPRRVLVGGYSSGGDLAYRTAFDHSSAIAGLLVINTAPFDTAPFDGSGLAQDAALAEADTLFHVVHSAHVQDPAYDIDLVRRETDAMVAAGFPLVRLEGDGTHFDEPDAVVDGHPVPGTNADIRTLLTYLDDGWLAPAR